MTFKNDFVASRSSSSEHLEAKETRLLPKHGLESLTMVLRRAAADEATKRCGVVLWRTKKRPYPWPILSPPKMTTAFAGAGLLPVKVRLPPTTT